MALLLLARDGTITKINVYSIRHILLDFEQKSRLHRPGSRSYNFGKRQKVQKVRGGLNVNANANKV